MELWKRTLGKGSRKEEGVGVGDASLFGECQEVCTFQEVPRIERIHGPCPLLGFPLHEAAVKGEYQSSDLCTLQIFGQYF